MATLLVISALSALPLALAHMQMSSPSPLRDPHALDRPNEPKDYNILNPLNPDGSNFACKGYHLNTPLTTVATYEAGSKQTLKLRGSATHGGGSCQISLSCDGGNEFYVIESMIGGCPLRDNYDFTVPSDIPPTEKCLMAWTWFNYIGNREMYMNCAVIDITNKKWSKRDTQVSAAKALSKLPQLFVANLANINDCRTQETVDLVFDNPGKSVIYGKKDAASLQPNYSRGQCTGKPSKSAGSKDSSSTNSGGSSSKGQGNKPAQSQSASNNCAAKMQDGQWHPECSNPSANQPQQQPAQKQQQPQRPQQQPRPPKNSVPQRPKKSKPNTKVQQDLDAYLATLYGRGLGRREIETKAEDIEDYSLETFDSAPQYPHGHGADCKHKSTSHPHEPSSHSKDIALYAQEDADYDEQDVYNQGSEYHKDSDYAYKRVTRQRRWTSYDKRADGPRKPIKFQRVDEDTYQKQPAPIQEEQVSTKVSDPVATEAPAQESSQSTTQTSTDTPVQRHWNDMSESEKFEAFLRRMVELSTNMASLVKYAAASTVNLPWYPPASTYDRKPDPAPETPQNASLTRRLVRRGGALSARSPAQVYPGPSVGSISAPGDATDMEDGFRKWFPDLVQGLVIKRQLVDPVTSEASADAGDGINFFDALSAAFWNLFGNLFGDDTDSNTDPVPPPVSVPDSTDIPLVQGEPDIYSGKPDFPDFEVPDLDGITILPPQILAPEPPVPELLPGYELGPDGPVWTGEGPDPLAGDSSPDPSVTIITITPVDDGLNLTTIPCIEPIPQIGFNSCLGGCNHTAEEIAAHEVYLENFAKEHAAFEECVKNQALNGISSPPSHGIWHSTDDTDDAPSEAEDAGDRRPRPGMSLPLIPYPIPDNSTIAAPVNATPEVLPAVASPGNETDSTSDLLPYQNKTLGELVSEIVENPDVLAVPEGEIVDEVTNSLQDAVDEAEAGVTIPTDTPLLDPTKVDSIADVLPWVLGPGPVIVDDVPADEGGAKGEQ